MVGLTLNQRGLRHELAARDSTVAALQQTVAARNRKFRNGRPSSTRFLDPGISLTTLASTQAPEPIIQFFWNHRTNLALVQPSG